MTLYELTGEMLQLLDMAEDADVDEDALRDTIEAVEGEIEYKADAYAKVIKQMEADAEALKKEADRLSERKKAIDKNIDRIKKALEASMIATGKTKFKTELFNFSIAKNPAKLELAEDIDMDSIPAEYITFAQPTIDKTAVKNAIKAGESFEWAKMVQGESLRIK